MGGNKTSRVVRQTEQKHRSIPLQTFLKVPPPHPSPHLIGETAAVTWFNPYLKGYIENSLPPKIDVE